MKASNAARPSAFVSPDLLQLALGLRLLALWQLGEHVCSLVHPAALLARFRPYFAGGLPEAQTAVGDGQFRPHVEPAALQVEQQAAPIVRTFPCAIDKTDQLLLALRRRPDQHENALLLVLEACFEMDSICPDVNVAFARQIAHLPLGMILLPAVLEAADRAGEAAHSHLDARTALGPGSYINGRQIKPKLRCTPEYLGLIKCEHERRWSIDLWLGAATPRGARQDAAAGL
jgi:hypothetical protein